MSSATIIRVVKKRPHSEVHHGGAWKVAYADFVTAMMALFMVMWIITMSQPTKEDIQNYFNHPFSAAQSKAGISSLATGGKIPFATGYSPGLNAKNWHDLALEVQRDELNRVKENVSVALDSLPELARLRKYVTISLTDTGLVIELIEAQDSLFFGSGSSLLPPTTQHLLAVVAVELGRLPNPVIIEGYTDAQPFSGRPDYSNWELSTDRANAARRVMNASGLRPRQVVEVCGYADSKLRRPDQPAHYSNRRIAIRVNFMDLADENPESIDGAPGASPGQAPDTHFDPQIRPSTPAAVRISRLG